MAMTKPNLACPRKIRGQSGQTFFASGFTDGFCLGQRTNFIDPLAQTRPVWDWKICRGPQVDPNV